jgi:hypothetical protein
MDATRKVLVIIGSALAIIVAGVVIGMLATSGTEVTHTSIAPPANSAAGTVVQVERPTGPPPLAVSPQSPAVPGALPESGPEAVLTNTAALSNDWSERLDTVLAAENSERDKANLLLAMFPHLPKDGQEEVAQHLTNLVDDDDYAKLGKFLTNSVLAEEVLDILFTDLFNRPNALKLPLLVDVARDPKHPKAGEAKDLLELYLEEDYGTDWALWRTKAELWLKENPE